MRPVPSLPPRPDDQYLWSVRRRRSFARGSQGRSPAQPSETHRGYELLFIPEERSWYYRDDPEAPLSATSYRSAFLGRRAIDAELDEPAPAPKPEPARKRS